MQIFQRFNTRQLPYLSFRGIISHPCQKPTTPPPRVMNSKLWLQFLQCLIAEIFSQKNLEGKNLRRRCSLGVPKLRPSDLKMIIQMKNVISVIDDQPYVYWHWSFLTLYYIGFLFFSRKDSLL